MSKSTTCYLMLTAFLVTGAVALTGCSGSVSPSGGESAGHLANLQVTQTDGQECGPGTFTLWAGQTIDVGTITVSNDADRLYVTYNTTNDWWITEAQLYVLQNEPTSRLIPGHAPYKEDFDLSVQEHTFVVPKEELTFEVDCGTELWLQAHAVVVKIMNGEVVDDETAYGGEITRPRRGAWYGNIMHVWCCDWNGNDECQEETAWGGDTAGGGPRWWFYYDTEGPGTQTVWAGQTINVGTAHVTEAESNQRTVTIDLAGGWELQPGGETVKIQGYDTIPDSPGAVGQFTTYKGDELTVTVADSPYYAIHLDVQLCP